MRVRILVVAFLLTVSIDAAAQEFTGSITGRIVDATRAPLPGVSITVEGDAIQGPRTAVSEADGSYRLRYLPQGRYRVTYQKPTFKTIVYEGATVEVGKTITMNVTMQVAEIEETVVVTGSSPTVDVRSATVGTNFGASMLRNIPSQRDIFALLAATPGITMPRVDVGGNTAGTQSAYRAYGLAGQSITTVDGVNITEGAAAIGVYIDFGALAEVKIAAAGNSAEVPVAGAAVTAVVKSGGNTHHGEVYAEIKPGGDPRFTGAENFIDYRDINGQLGGPFVKDRLWYFVSFRDQQAVSMTAMYDKPAAEGGTQGHRFPTRTTQYTLKLNYQLDTKSTLAFMTQWSRKYQPYRFGSGLGAAQYVIESTAHQDSWGEIGKIDYMRAINNRATLDASINVYASQFPLDARTDKTPIFDEVTFDRRGAYEAPGYSEEWRWHYNTNLTLYADRHDMRVGYLYQWYGPRYTAHGAPGPAGTAGHFYFVTTDGVPTSFVTDNGPVSSVNALENHALFLQDRFQLTPKLTLNYGVRFDRYRSFYPEQRFGLERGKPCDDDVDCEAGPFAVQAVAAARDVVTFNSLVPRFALIYDIFGNAKTAVKASWGRYATNPAELIASLVNPIDLVTRKYAWDSEYLTSDLAVAATRITPAYVATRQPIAGGAQLTPATVDPELKNSYTDEYTFGVEQELAGDLRGHVAFVRKRQKHAFGRYDRLRTFANFSPVQALDPGPDGLVDSADDRTITVWETSVPAGTTDYYLTNKPIGDTYETFELGVTKRMRDDWQLTAGFDWTKRTLASLFSEDPNIVFWNSTDTETTGWTLKASGTYLFSKGVLISVWYNGMKGEPYGRLFTITPPFLALADPGRTTPLAQGNMRIIAEKAGTYYLPAVNQVALRVQKEFVIKQTQRLQLMVNVFNFFNTKTVTGVNQITGPTFNEPITTTGGTVLRLSVRYTF